MAYFSFGVSGGLSPFGLVMQASEREGTLMLFILYCIRYLLDSVT